MKNERNREKITRFLVKRIEKPRIHVTEIRSSITFSEREIKNFLVKFTAKHPELWSFDYSTGWLERTTPVSGNNRQKRILFLLIFLLSAVPIIICQFIDIYGLAIFIGFIFELAVATMILNYFVSSHTYEEARNKAKEMDLRAMAVLTTIVDGRIGIQLKKEKS